MEFRVRIERAGAGREIENHACATYDNTLGNAPTSPPPPTPPPRR
ncbi:hypothetical protein [Nonomuraea sp. NPDC049758]